MIRMVCELPVSKGLMAVCLSILLALSGTGVMASERITLRIGYIDFPPLEYRDENGQPAGTMVDVTRKVAAEAGYDLKYTYLPVARAFLYLRTGTLDLMPGVTKIPQLAEIALESRVSPMTLQLSAWSHGNTPPISNFEQLDGRVLILMAGYTYGGLLDYLEASPTIKVSHAPSHEAALEMLRRNRGDYLLNYREAIHKTLQAQPVDNLHESEIRKRYGAWLFSRQNPQAEYLRDAFDEAYLRLVARGELPPSIARRDGQHVAGYPLVY